MGPDNGLFVPFLFRFQLMWIFLRENLLINEYPFIKPEIPGHILEFQTCPEIYFKKSHEPSLGTPDRGCLIARGME